MNMMRMRSRSVPQKDNSLIIDGLAYLEDVAEKLDVDFGDVEFETLNGYLTSILGHIPTKRTLILQLKQTDTASPFFLLATRPSER